MRSNKRIGQPWGVDASTIGKYYETLAVNDDAYFENRVAAAKFEVGQRWSKLGAAGASDG